MKGNTADLNPDLVVRVVPDETAPKPYPLVIVVGRNARTVSGGIIHWIALPASKGFVMKDLEDLTSTGVVFQDIVVTPNKVQAKFVPTAGDPADTEYEYRLTIQYGGDDLNTDLRTSGPTQGKAVIRN